jgi:hypothetical protein
MTFDQNGKIWGWGLNEYCRMGLSDSSQLLKTPFEIYSLNQLNMKALKIRVSGGHTLVQFENDEKQKVFYSVGLQEDNFWTHLASEEKLTTMSERPFREIDSFKGVELVDFCAMKYSTAVIIKGGEKGIEDIHRHTLEDGSQYVGIVHTFKKDGKWVTVTDEDVKSGKHQVPDLCMTIRCPVDPFAQNQWPDLDSISKEIFDEKATEFKKF